MDLVLESATDSIDTIEIELAREDDNIELPPSDIVAYNELRSCAELYRLHITGQLDIQPEFQREIVWNLAAQTRFIDSLIKQLPIPSLCISLDYRTDKRLVIDGLQRIQSIINFLDEENDWQLADIEDIDTRISGKLVSEIKRTVPMLFTRVQNTSLPITILRCNYSKESHINYLFTIFHRLNSGGSRLNNQEIRNAIFSGPFNNFLKTLNANENWQIVAGIKTDKSYRFLKEELLLRFFAFYERQATYSGRLAKFLNKYMFDNRNLYAHQLDIKKQLFEETINLIFEKIANRDVLTKTSNVILEALLVGVATNLDYLKNLDASYVKQLYEQMLNQDAFSEANLRSGLSGTEKVNNRLNTAKQIFSNQNG